MIKTFTGPMFSGKTNEALNTYKKIWNKEHVMCFKPSLDTRDNGIIKSRDFKEGIKAINIDKFEDILDYLKDDTKTIFIDEAQFLTGNYQILNYLSILNNIDIYISALNMNTYQEPFGLIGNILAISDYIVNTKAICYDCNKEATYSYNDEEISGIKVGDNNYYPLCRECLIKRVGIDKLKERYLNK